MSFEIRELTLEDERRIYSEQNRISIAPFAPFELSSGPTGHYWLLDDCRCSFFARLKPRDPWFRSNRYILSLPEGVAIVQAPEGLKVVVQILSLSEGLIDQFHVVKGLILDAFRVGGRRCVGFGHGHLDDIEPIDVVWEK